MTKESLQNELNRLVEGIIRQYQPEKIILFGSMVTGKVNRSSDIDLLVIKDTETRRLNRRGEALRGIKHHPPVDVIILTPDELEHLINRDAPFIKDIVTNGKVVYEREKSMV